jgi:hypothetical protein
MQVRERKVVRTALVSSGQMAGLHSHLTASDWASGVARASVRRVDRMMAAFIVAVVGFFGFWYGRGGVLCR